MHNLTLRTILFTALTLALLILLTVLVAPAVGQQQAPSGLQIPDDFNPLFAAPGVKLYQQEIEEEEVEEEAEEAEEDDADEEEDEEEPEPVAFMQVVNLEAGASLHFVLGEQRRAGAGRGAYGGASPAFERHFLPHYWSHRPPGAVCLTNSQYFQDLVEGVRVNPSELSFPLKVDGNVLTEGYSRTELIEHKQMLEIWPHHAEISPLSYSALYRSTAPNIIAGIAPRANLRPYATVGRTFIGLVDDDGDGRKETILIYTANLATQIEAIATMRAFGAESVLMLDGGGSTQLLCRGEWLVTQFRPLPQIMIAVSAPPNWPRPRLPACCRASRTP
ncbi:MAG: phosphodiester glycosidase family protein [Candidatus Promineifilaceae bacterium]|nr:phosphodiester glycosidase family protein [Candidatus Promineifilaceae bacterium]